MILEWEYVTAGVAYWLVELVRSLDRQLGT